MWASRSGNAGLRTNPRKVCEYTLQHGQRQLGDKKTKFFGGEPENQVPHPKTEKTIFLAFQVSSDPARWVAGSVPPLPTSVSASLFESVSVCVCVSSALLIISSTQS